MFGLLGSLLPLVVVGAIVYGLVSAARRRSSDSTGPTQNASPVRRLFVYGMTFAALVVAGIGLTGLIGRILTTAAARPDTDLAESLALAVVGVPVFLGLARWLWRTHVTEPAEARSLAWALYINGALLVGVGVVIGSAFTLADNLINGDAAGEAIAGLIVWSGIWAAHWQAWRRFPPTLVPRAHLWVASAAGLSIAAGAVGYLIAEALSRLINDAAAAATSDELRMAIAALVIGAAVWSWHWLGNGLRSVRDGGWHTYVLIIGVLLSLVVGISGAAFMLYLVLQWFVGDPGSATAAEHFADAAPAIAAAVVGFGVWWYHRSVIGPRTARVRTEVDRVYDYLVAGVSLATVATAIGILVLAFFSVITPTDAIGSEGGSVNTLLGAVTALLVGGPMWLVTWRRIEENADTEERRSPSRRVYLLGIFGVGGAIAFGALIALLVAVFQAALGEGSGNALAGEIDVPVALLVTTGAAAAYHWVVFRSEREEAAPIAKRDVLLVLGDGLDVEAIAQRTNTRVMVLHSTTNGGALSAEPDDIVAAIAGAEGERLLVLARPGNVEVIPYE